MRRFIPAKDVPALVKAIREYERLPAEQLESIGKRGKDWLLENRPYDRLAAEYCKLFETEVSRNEAPV